MKITALRLSLRDRFASLLPVASSLMLTAMFAPCVQAAPVQAKKADEFVDSVGVCLHVQNYNDAQWATVQAQLGALGVRYYRDGLEHVDNASYTKRLRGLYEAYGMKMLAVCGPYSNNALQPNNGSLSHVADKVAANKEWLLAVEGPNEPEYFWYDGWKFGGFSDRPNQVVWYQNALYDAIKANPVTREVNVVSFATARGETTSNWFKGKPLIKHDIVAYHHYNGRNLPNFYDTIRDARAYYSSDKDAYLTEHGYRIRGDGSVSQKAQMKLDVRSMGAFFDERRTLKTFFYVAGPDTAGGEDYGLDNLDYTPRPVYTAMKDVLSYLREAKWNLESKTWDAPKFTPGSLDYEVTGDKSQYGWRVLQKSSGDFYLMAVPYIDVANRGDGSDITNSPHKIKLNFPRNQKVLQYRADDKGNYVETVLTEGATSVEVGLPDTLTIFKLPAAANSL